MKDWFINLPVLAGSGGADIGAIKGAFLRGYLGITLRGQKREEVEVELPQGIGGLEGSK